MKSLTVWDSEAQATESGDVVYQWNGYAETLCNRSLLRYIDANGERLRQQYADWIHDLGEYQVNGKSLIEGLALDTNGLSYWWMTLFAEQSPWKSRAVMNVIRLLALEEIILVEQPEAVRVVSANKIIADVVGAFCRAVGVPYVWERVASKPQEQSLLARGYRALPHTARALIHLARHAVGRWALRSADTSRWFDGAGALFFASYFIHLDQQSAAEGRFHSRHWEKLPELARERGLETNWLQHFLHSGVAPSTDAALALVCQFDQQPQQNGFHTFLDAYLSWRVLLRVLRRWTVLRRIVPSHKDVYHAFTPRGSKLSLWPVVREDWENSMSGALATDNLLWIVLFDEALRRIPRQTTGLYLYENQGWERAFIHAWRKYGHGRLIGVAHSTVRFWDLRYFVDPRTTQSPAPNGMPSPDVVALNGKAATDAFLRMGYPADRTAQTEALRYGHLSAPRAERPLASRETPVQVLVLTDYHAASTISMLRMLEQAATRISQRVAYTVKPHPGYMVRPRDYPSLNLKIVTAPLANILDDFEMAIASNNTSAAVDAYFAGLSVIVSLDATELNFSPLRGQPQVRFVGDSEQLAEALQHGGRRMSDAPHVSGFFCLDPEFQRWKRLLGLGAHAS